MTPWELEEVYIAIGKAIWHLQFLEDVLVTYVTMRLKVGRPITIHAAMEILARERRKTLGILFREAEAGGLIHGEIGNAFKLLVDERNWLVHRSMHECSDGLYRYQERQALLSRLDNLTEEAIRLKKALYEDVRAWLANLGVNVAEAEALGEEQFRRLRS